MKEGLKVLIMVSLLSGFVLTMIWLHGVTGMSYWEILCWRDGGK